jgi:proteasome lid subunit RPN8/RPN11
VDVKTEGASTLADADQLAPQDFPLRRLPALTASGRTGFRVVVARSVLREIEMHGRTSLDAEVCGILLGSVYHDDDGPWCFIEAAVRGNFAAGKQTQVTITSETWTHVNEVKDRFYPDKRFVGWYHTHPGFGIFLSGMDDFICANFFGEPWQLALVYDPKSDERGIFVWRKGKTVNEPFLVVDESGAGITAPTPAVTPNGALPSGTATDLSLRLQLLEERQRWMLIGLGVAALLAILWPLLLMLFMPSGERHSAAPHYNVPPPISTDATGGN